MLMWDVKNEEFEHINTKKFQCGIVKKKSQNGLSVKFSPFDIMWLFET